MIKQYVPYWIMGALVALVVLLPELSRRNREERQPAGPAATVLRDTVRMHSVDTVVLRDTVRRTVYVPALPSAAAPSGGRSYRLENDTISLHVVADSLRALSYELRMPVRHVYHRDTLLVHTTTPGPTVVRLRDLRGGVGATVCWPLGAGVALSVWRGRWQIGAQYYPAAGAAAASLQWCF